MNAPPMTPGEHLELRRRRDDCTQAEAAGLLGVPVYRFRQWEADQQEGAPRLDAGDMALFEWCWLMRRRSGLRLRDVGERLGLSPKWIHRAERGAITDLQLTALAQFWQQRGAA